jgi:hypothetical protein
MAAALASDALAEVEVYRLYRRRDTADASVLANKPHPTISLPVTPILPIRAATAPCPRRAMIAAERLASHPLDASGA